MRLVVHTLYVSIIGCGCIGQHLARRITKGDAGNVRLVSIYDRHMEKAERTAKNLCVKAARSIEDVIKEKHIELVVEAVSQEAVRLYGCDILESGKHMLILSSSALFDTRFAKRFIEIAMRKKLNIYIPSGSITGVDGIKGHSIAGISEAILEYRKSPQGFNKRQDAFQSLFKDANNPKLSTIYEGPAREAIRLFPRRFNIASTISLIGIGPKRTKVRVVVDPSVKGTCPVYFSTLSIPLMND